MAAEAGTVCFKEKKKRERKDTHRNVGWKSKDLECNYLLGSIRVPYCSCMAFRSGIRFAVLVFWLLVKMFIL